MKYGKTKIKRYRKLLPVSEIISEEIAYNVFKISILKLNKDVKELKFTLSNINQDCVKFDIHSKYSELSDFSMLINEIKIIIAEFKRRKKANLKKVYNV